MFEIIRLPVSIDHLESADLIERYPAWNCQDWRCPSREHCGRHFGLSKRYAAMGEMQPGDALVIPERDGPQCEHYFTASIDHFAVSLGERGLIGVGGSA